MRLKLTSLFLLCVVAVLAADKALPVVPTEDKLAIREAQISAQGATTQILDLTNKILQASTTLADMQKKAEPVQTAFETKVKEVTEKLRKESGCTDCVLNGKLEFVKPEAPPAAAAPQATPPADKK